MGRHEDASPVQREIRHVWCGNIINVMKSPSPDVFAVTMHYDKKQQNNGIGPWGNETGEAGYLQDQGKILELLTVLNGGSFSVCRARNLTGGEQRAGTNADREGGNQADLLT